MGTLSHFCKQITLAGTCSLGLMLSSPLSWANTTVPLKASMSWSSLPSLSPMNWLFPDTPAERSTVSSLHVRHALYEYYQAHQLHAISYLMAQESLGQITPNETQSQLVKSALHFNYGMTTQAQSLLDEMVKNPTQYPDAAEYEDQIWFLLGRQYYANHYFSDAQQQFSQVDVKALPNPLREEMHYYQADIAIQQNDYITANYLANTLTDNSVAAIIFRHNLAQAQQAKQDYRAALNLLTSLQPYTGASPIGIELYNRTLLLQGYLHQKLNEPELALPIYRNMVAEGPWLPDAMLHTAWAAAQAKKLKTALTLTQHHAQQRSTEPLQWRLADFELALLNAQWSAPIDTKQGALGYERVRADITTHLQALSEINSDVQLEQLIDLLLTSSFNLLSTEHLKNEDGASASITDTASTDRKTENQTGQKSIPGVLLDHWENGNWSSTLTQLNALYLIEQTLTQWQKKFDVFSLLLVTRQAARAEAIETLPIDQITEKLSTMQQQFNTVKQRFNTFEQSDTGFEFLPKEQQETANRLKQATQRFAQLIAQRDLSDTEQASYQTRLSTLERRLLWDAQVNWHPNWWAHKKELLESANTLADTQAVYNRLQQQLANATPFSATTDILTQQQAELTGLLERTQALILNTRSNITAQLSDRINRHTQQLIELQKFTELKIAQSYRAQLDKGEVSAP